MFATAAIYALLAATALAPVATPAVDTTHLTVNSAAVDENLGVNVLEPANPGRRDERSLLVFLHGRGGSEQTFVEDEAVRAGLEKLGARAPIVAFPDGGDHSYWHDRAEGDWGKYVMREVIPLLVGRYGIDPHRIAIGGISMGGFGAYDLALLHPARFCAVGGHSPALWFDSGETAPGAFDSAADFDRNDVVGRLRRDPDAFGKIRIWNDYGGEDPFRAYDEGFVDALEDGDAKLTTHSWSGGHNSTYWDRHWPVYLRFYANALAHCK
jgi:S-formylglutathione hydrolase FrmB